MKRTKLFSYSFFIIISAYSQNFTTDASNSIGTAGTLTIKVTNSSPLGTSSAHVLAIWIQNSDGQLVNTLLYYTSNGNNSAQDMSTWWNLMSGTTWSTKAKLTDADAVTGATATSFVQRTCYWGKTVDLSTVPDGVYTIKMQICNEASVGSPKSTTYTFTKGPNPQSQSPANQPSFNGVTISWVPKSTGIEEIKLAKQYQVYPNPTRSATYVTGFDIQEIELCTMEGKSIFKTKEQTLDLSRLPKGVYFARIISSQGVFGKKIQKL